jgi:hypothetical protein
MNEGKNDTTLPNFDDQTDNPSYVCQTESTDKTTIEQTESNATKRLKRTPSFPTTLHEMLDNAEDYGYDHIISWMPDGKSFKIHDDTDDKLGSILSRYYKATKARSFARQLQIYGFDRVCRGPQKGLCKHILFQKGKRNLLAKRGVEEYQVSNYPPSVLNQHHPSEGSSLPPFHPASFVSSEIPTSFNNNVNAAASNIDTTLGAVLPSMKTVPQTASNKKGDDVRPTPSLDTKKGENTTVGGISVHDASANDGPLGSSSEETNVNELMVRLEEIDAEYDDSVRSYTSE